MCSSQPSSPTNVNLIRRTWSRDLQIVMPRVIVMTSREFVMTPRVILIKSRGVIMRHVILSLCVECWNQVILWQCHDMGVLLWSDTTQSWLQSWCCYVTCDRDHIAWFFILRILAINCAACTSWPAMVVSWWEEKGKASFERSVSQILSRICLLFGPCRLNIP